LQKEKDHVEGFAPEVAWVTHGGDEKCSQNKVSDVGRIQSLSANFSSPPCVTHATSGANPST
ncbi:hypothetical protein ACT453_62620, partial [Bacillus sp. D-CC]